MFFVSYKKGAFALFFIPLFVPLFLRADALYVLGEGSLLLEKTGMKIIEISTELKEKSGISVYVSAVETIGSKTLKEYEEETIKRVAAPFVWVYFIQDIKKINILNSPELDKSFDKNSIFWDYIMPLIPKSDHELTNERISAALLNGYAQITDEIAKHHKIELTSGIKSQNDWIGSAVKYLFYFMIISVFGILIYSYFKRNR